jgi:hypothetical protein
MKINATWHKANRMPKNPSEEQRLNWHIEHLKFCACRLPSSRLMEEIRKFGKNVVQ